MDRTIKPGDRCIVTRDVVVGDHLAFISGDPVVVESVHPNPQRPDNKYVVFSGALQKRFLLTDADLGVVPGSGPPDTSPPVPSGSPGDVFAGQAPTSSPGDVFAGQGSTGSQESVFADRIRAPEAPPGFRSSPAFRPVVIGACLTVIIAIIVVVITLGSGSAKAPPGIPADWKTYSGKGIRLWLPPAYEVGKSFGDLSGIASKLKEPAAGYDQISRAIKRDPTSIVLFAFDADSANAGHSSSVGVTSQEMPEGMGLQDSMDAGIVDQAPTLTISDKRIVSLGGRQMAQMELVGKIGSKQVTQVVYIASGGQTVIQAVFQCYSQDFQQQLPVFQKIIGSVRSS